MAATRRWFLKSGAAAALAASIPDASAVVGRRRPRVGIVGGGLAGVSCAWLLDRVADVVLFESRAELGGHAQTIPVVAGDEEIQVDVGAQFVAGGPHPTYMRLLEVLGLLDPAHPDEDATLEVDMTITVTAAGADLPRFVSPSKQRAWPILAGWNRAALWAFLVFTRAARRLSEDGDWLLPLGTWLHSLPLPAEQREGLLLPLLAAMVGCSLEQARSLSARGAVLFVAKALPEKLLDPVRYGNSVLGLGGNVRRLADLTPGLDVRLGAAVTALRPRPHGGLLIECADGTSQRVDLAVLASPPYVAAPLLSALPQLAGAAAVLERFEYFDAEVAIHRDPVYMPQKKRHWSAYNAHVAGDRAEGSVWYGALRPVPAGQTPLPLFKSWATARSEPPGEELFRRAFRHPLVTPAFIGLQQQLAAYQGREGVFFAGSYTREVDSQETALVSAVEVVRALEPDAPNLRLLEG
jgi:uncharacterized protein